MLKYRRLILIKKYLLISLLLSIFPLMLVALAYDRYSVYLLGNILSERLDADVEAVSEKIREFLYIQSGRLNNLADLPEIEKIFTSKAESYLPDKLLDFVYLEVGSPDVYAAVFFDADEKLIRMIPDRERKIFAKTDFSVADFAGLEIINPVLPKDGRPGWFGIRRDIWKGQEKIGSILLKLRLASLTESTYRLYRRDFYEPRIVIGDDTYLSILGTSVSQGITLTDNREIIPGWDLFLVKNQKQVEEPRVKLRYLLLLIVAIACFSIVAVFVHMSERLAGFILPLTEGARAIARGDFSMRISERAPGELRDLSQSFNQMSNQLESMIESRVDSERRATLGNLAAGIAHEIRNPLTTLHTSIHALDKAEKDQKRKEIFSLISEEILRIDGMVEQFLSYARPHAPSIEDIAVREFLKNIESLIAGTLVEADIEFAFIGDMSLMIRADPAQLRQVFMNLMLNSVQSMPNGGRLSIKIGTMNKKAVITVSDTGEGMDAETLSKVKTPFFTTKTRGSGLGLPICTQLLRENKGTLIINSRVGKGTDAIVTLPLATEK